MDSHRALAAALSTALATIVLGALVPVASARTVYTGNYVSGSVSALTIAPDGSLAPVAGSPFAAVPSTDGLAISSDGSTLIAVRSENPGALTAFSVAQDGALAVKSGPTPATGNFPAHATIDPTGRFAYVSNSSGSVADRVVSGFALAGASMPVTLGAPFPGGGINLAGIASSVDGRFVYLGHNGGPANVRGYSVGPDGRLTALSESPFNLGVSSAATIAVSPDGRFAFVADSGNEALVTATIGTDGTLTKVGSPVPAGGVDPEFLALTRDGRFLLAGNAGAAARGLTVFAVGADGGLTPAPGGLAPIAALPTGLAVTPDGRRAYVPVQAASSNVVGFSLDGNGALAALPGSPYSSGGSNNDFSDQTLAISPDQGPRAAVTATVKGRVATFSGVGSSDPDGSVAVYEWAFGDGKTATSTTAEIKHTYAVDGSYDATLRVVDNEGCSAARVYTGVATLCTASPAAQAAAKVVVDLPPVVSKPTVKKRSVKGKLKSLTVGFRISEAATAKVVVQRQRSGRRGAAKRYAAKLTRSVKAKQAGPVTLKLGKKAVKRLKPGSYRVAITARDKTGKKTSKPVYKKFKIAKPKRRG